MLPRKTFSALAAVGAAAAIAIPAATANAATTAAPAVDPTVCQLLSSPTGLFSPAFLPGGASLAATLAHAGSTVGCAAPAPQTSRFPALPGLPAFAFPH